MNSILILGRQPAIGRAELESRLGSEHVQPLGDFAVASDVEPADIPFDQLGGSIRLAKPFAMIPETNWRKVIVLLAKELVPRLARLPEGKLKLGLSAFGLPLKTPFMHQASLELKKACKKAGRSTRVIPNTEIALSSAQVLHNHLTGELGMELLVMKSGRHILVAQTVAVQDITAYAARDQGRPKRDARVGMLPPKLAQIIVNLSLGQSEPSLKQTVLDPFCGTGVILQEALLMGCSAYGTDLEPRMIEYTQANLEWLATHGTHNTPLLEAGDATDHTWQSDSISCIASETYLGRALSSWPNQETLRDITQTCNIIIEKFLKNMHDQITPGTRLCLALPCWKSPSNQFFHLPLLDRLEEIGYNRMSFKHAKAQELVYYRPDQLVARELLVITRK